MTKENPQKKPPKNPSDKKLPQPSTGGDYWRWDYGLCLGLSSGAFGLH